MIDPERYGGYSESLALPALDTFVVAFGADAAAAAFGMSLDGYVPVPCDPFPDSAFCGCLK
jgi:hypothetical protein